MFVQRSTKYQKWLGIVNVILLLGSIVLIFVGQSLQMQYYMDKLGMIDTYFQILPWVLIGSGVLSFLISTAGFIFSSTIESRCFLYFYAISCIVLSLVQFFTIYVSFEARRVISTDESWTRNNLDLYYKDDAVRENWDFLQSRLRCCGVRSTGYTDYLNLGSENGNRFPDSCCYDYETDKPGATCSSNFKKSDRNIKITDFAHEIYLRGCVDILKNIYQTYLENFLLYVSLSCCLYALVLIVATTLAFAFSAQINRHKKRESEWSPGDVVGGGMGFGTLGPEGINSLSPDGINNGNIALDDLPGDHQL